MNIKLASSLVCIALLTSCSYLGPKEVKLSNNLSDLREKQHESAKQYVTATVDTLEEIDSANETEEIKLALLLSKSAEDLLGTPEAGNRIDVQDLLSKDKDIRTAALKLLASKRKSDAKYATRIRTLEDNLAEVRGKLVEKGKQKEIEENSNIVSRIWHWAVATIGIGGMIALCVFFPALIPILGTIVSYLIGMLPKLIGFFGVVGKSVVENVVKGVGEVRNTLQKAPPGKTYTADEVLSLINTELAKSTDKTDKDVINHLKDKLNS